jgi:hypothetical protein
VGDQASAMASEELLKEIGVDIKKFLEKRDQIKKDEPKKTLPSFQFSLPSLQDLGNPTG